MNKPDLLSIELLHSYVDDELDTKEREIVLQAMADYPEVAQEVAELQQLKAMLKAARPDEKSLPKIIRPQNRFTFNLHCKAMAASLLLAVITIGALFVTQQNDRNKNLTLSKLSETGQIVESQSAIHELRVVLHINQTSNQIAEMLFEKIYLLLNQHGKNIQLEVVASGPGLNILSQDDSPFPEQIQHIRTQHDNVVFIACQSTLQRMVMKLKKQIPLLPEAMLTASGPELIKLRKSQGWEYIKINS